MMKIGRGLMILVFVLVGNVFAQINSTSNKDSIYITDNTQEAIFPGGNETLFNFLLNNLKMPIVDGEERIHGIIYITFMVDVDGKLLDIKVKKGIQEYFDKEALRVIRLMPNWIPAKQNGKFIKSQINLPIRFK